MKSTLFSPRSTSGLLIFLLLLTGMAAEAQGTKPPHYRVTDLGTLGGSYSFGFGINDSGIVSGAAATPTQTDGIAETAFLWDQQLGPINLGTLGGAACPDCSSAAGGPNARGVSPIFSETAETDPHGEDFCGFGTHRQCLAAIWKNGVMLALPSLQGGNNGQGVWTNNRGLTVGLAENGIEDPTCSTVTPFQVLRFEAVIWEQDGKVRELRPLKGDDVGYAFGLNENGEAVGVSGLCSNTRVPPLTPGANAPHGVLWESDGTPVNIGSLGGGPFTIPSDVNDSGLVAGASLSTDGTVHPFFWTKQNGIKDLGTFPGAILTGIPCCHTLNNKGDAVGLTVDGTTFNMRAVLFHDGKEFDLNTLIPADSGWSLQFGGSINDRGQIVGWGTINGNTHAFVATPSDDDQNDSEDRETSIDDGASNDVTFGSAGADASDISGSVKRLGPRGALLRRWR